MQHGWSRTLLRRRIRFRRDDEQELVERHVANGGRSIRDGAEALPPLEIRCRCPRDVHRVGAERRRCRQRGSRDLHIVLGMPVGRYRDAERRLREDEPRRAARRRRFRCREERNVVRSRSDEERDRNGERQPPNVNHRFSLVVTAGFVAPSGP